VAVEKASDMSTRANAPSIGAKNGVAGYVDICTSSCIAGWAWDSKRPDQRIVVEIFLDGQQVAQVTADQYREDLKRNQIGDGRHGFAYFFSVQIDRANQRVSAVAPGTSSCLPRS
jgi:hypothetical protein